MPRQPVEFDKEADVVVVGYGGAGATAAITAHDRGARVLVLEKSASGGGNTRLATMTFARPTAGREAVEHIKALCFGTVAEDVIEAFVEWGSQNVEFIHSLGGKVEISEPGPTFANVAGAESMRRYYVVGPEPKGGQRLWNLLDRQVASSDVEVMTKTPAVELITNTDKDDGNRRVIGVKALSNGTTLNVKAKRAVIMTCGGFEYDEDMKRQYLPGATFYCFGHPGNEGDGVRIAQQVGAALWHMKAISAPLGYKFPEYEAAFGIKMPSNGYVIVDRYGRRFVNETGDHYSKWLQVTYFDIERLEYPRVPSFMVFDESTRLKGPVSGVHHGLNAEFYRWSTDNSAEIERGWIAKGATLAELSEQLGLPPNNKLGETVARYNEYCTTGHDEEQERAADTLVRLEVPPFYATRVWPCLLNTQGGPKRNARAQILDPWNRPITGLYGAGELGSMWGFMYQSGGNLAECLAFGRIAGNNAAGEKPWGNSL